MDSGGSSCPIQGWAREPSQQSLGGSGDREQSPHGQRLLGQLLASLGLTVSV